MDTKRNDEMISENSIIFVFIMMDMDHFRRLHLLVVDAQANV